MGDQTGRPVSMNWAQALLVLCIGAGMVALGLAYRAIDSPQSASSGPAPAGTPAALAPAVTPSSPIPVAAASPTPADGVDELLTEDEAAQAYSQYVGEIQDHLMVLKLFGDLQSARLKRDYEFRDLQRLEADAETWKEAAYNAEEKILGAVAVQNISDEDAAIFGGAFESAQEFVIDYEAMTVDVSVLAHTGIAMTSEIEKDVAVATRAHQAFEKAVFDGYKHFGYTKAQIDPATLQIKPTKKPAATR